MKQLIFVLSCLGIFLHGAATNVMSLEAFLEAARTRNREFQILLNRELQLSYREILDRNPGDLALQLTADYALADSESGELRPGISLAKLFPASATELSAALRTQTASGGSVNSTLSAGISQDLLRNAFGSVERLKRHKSETAREIARLELIEAYENYLADLTARYHRWSLAEASLDNAREAVRGSQRLMENLEQKYRNKIASAGDVSKTRLQHLAKRDTLLSASNAYRRSCAGIAEAISLSWEDFQERGLHPVLPRCAPGALPDSFAREYGTFLEQSRTAAVLRYTDENAWRSLQLAKRELLPELSLSLEYQASAAGSGVPSGEDGELSAGAALTWLLPDRHDRAQRDLSAAEYSITTLHTSNTAAALAFALRAAYEQMTLSAQLLQSAEEKLSLSQQVADEKETYYAQGRATLTDLITEINTLDRYRYELSAAAVEHQLACLEWQRLTDTLAVEIGTQ